MGMFRRERSGEPMRRRMVNTRKFFRIQDAPMTCPIRVRGSALSPPCTAIAAGARTALATPRLDGREHIAFDVLRRDCGCAHNLRLWQVSSFSLVTNANGWLRLTSLAQLHNWLMHGQKKANRERAVHAVAPALACVVGTTTSTGKSRRRNGWLPNSRADHRTIAQAVVKEPT